jgi:hypothetical protein
MQGNVFVRQVRYTDRDDICITVAETACWDLASMLKMFSDKKEGNYDNFLKMLLCYLFFG